MSAIRRDQKSLRRSQPEFERLDARITPSTFHSTALLAGSAAVEFGQNQALPMYMIKGQRQHHGVYMSELQSESQTGDLGLKLHHKHHPVLLTEQFTTIGNPVVTDFSLSTSKLQPPPVTVPIIVKPPQNLGNPVGIALPVSTPKPQPPTVTVPITVQPPQNPGVPVVIEFSLSTSKLQPPPATVPIIVQPPQNLGNPVGIALPVSTPKPQPPTVTVPITVQPPQNPGVPVVIEFSLST